MEFLWSGKDAISEAHKKYPAMRFYIQHRNVIMEKNVETSKINLPFTGKKATILYPTDLGISVSISGKTIEFKLLHKYMAVIL